MMPGNTANANELAKLRSLQSSTTPPPPPPNGLTSFIKAVPLTTLNNSATNCATNIYKTISIQQHQQQVASGGSGSNSQTIAQLCSNLNSQMNQFQIQQIGNGSQLPMCYISNARAGTNSSYISQFNVAQTATSSLTLSNTTNSPNSTFGQNKVTNVASQQLSLGGGGGGNTASLSPSASPLKPNIIRKARFELIQYKYIYLYVRIDLN